MNEEPTPVRFSELCNFTDKQKAATQAADTHKYTLYGGSRGPGKSRWLRWYLLRFLLNTPKRYGLTGVRAGLFCEDYPNLKDRQIGKISAEFPQWLGELKEGKTDGLAFYIHPEYGGGVLALRNLDLPEKYQSAEFAAAGVDELTKNAVGVFDVLRASLRWPGIPTERCPFLGATNPGGIGHHWVQNYWGIDAPQALPKELRAAAQKFVFVRALPDDNPYLDEGYWAELNSLPPDLARAWRWGDWNVFVGQAFPTWRRDVHIIQPFDLSDYWPMWRAVDWGNVQPFCCLWLTKDPDTGRVFVVQELYQTGMTDRQQARAILENTPPEWDKRINLTYADPSMWERKSVEDRVFSTADEYRAEGVVLVKGDNSRIMGKRKVDTLLANLPDGKPGIQVWSTCANLIRTLPALSRSKRNPEDVNTDGEDHAYDALRYGLTSIHARLTGHVPVERRLGNIDPIFKRAHLHPGKVLGGPDF